jgi:hypothetical protein
MNTSIAIIATSISSLAASISAYVTYSTWRDSKSDERLIVSELQHGNVALYDHRKSVLWCALLNKSRKKVDIQSVFAYDNNNEPIKITWSNRIDDFGNPQNASGRLVVVDNENLYIRRNDGKAFNSCKIDIHHSFSRTPYRTSFDFYADEK